MPVTDKRQCWLRKLKAGDEVIVVDGWWRHGEAIVRISRVTPSGRMRIGTRLFDPGGREIGEGGGWGPRDFLSEPTPAALAAIHEARETAWLRAGLTKAVASAALATLRALAAVLPRPAKPTPEVP